MKATITVQRRSGNGRQLKRDARSFVKAWALPFLAKVLLRKSVLIAIGLGTLASWWIKHRFFRPKVRRFRLF